MMVREFLRNRLGVAGMTVIVLLIVFCFLGPIVYSTDQVHANVAITNVAPSGAHPWEPMRTVTTCSGG